MKLQFLLLSRGRRCFLLPGLLGLILAALPSLRAQSTAFTYNGRLQEDGQAVTGLYDFEFRLFNAALGGTQQGPTVTFNDLGVTNGLFLAALDFGANFPGPDRFLQINVRPGASAGAYTNLNPRQLITATPYAIRALEAGGVPAGAVNGTMLADGSVTATKIAPGAVSQLGAADGSPVSAVQVNTNGLVGVGTNAPQAGLHITASQSLMNLELLSSVSDERGGYTNLDGAYGAAAWGGYVAVPSFRDSGVTLLRATDPASPQLMFQIRDGDGAFTNLSGAMAVAMNSNVLAVAAGSSVTLIGWSNPTQPVKLAELRDGVGGWNELLGVRALALSGNLLAMGSLVDSAVTLADISNPAAPIKRVELKDGSLGYTNLQGVQSVALSGNLLAIGSAEGVTLVDVSNPLSPVKRAELRDGLNGFSALGFIQAVALSGNFLAVGGFYGVTLVDITNPSQPVLLSEWRGSNFIPQVSALAFSGGFLAAATSEPVEVVFFSLSVPTNLTVVASARNGMLGFNKLGSTYGLAFSGQTLVVPSAFGALTFMGLTSRSAGLISEGWVGIGTTKPAAALHVAGNVLVEGAQRVELNATYFQAGRNGSASGDYSTSLGSFTTASGSAATAMGQGTTASGSQATAMGYSSVASGRYSLAGGESSLASGDSAVALGYQAKATNTAAVAQGYSTTASGFSSTALGNRATASGDYSVSVGYSTVAAGANSAALGFFSQAIHPGTFVWSDSSQTDGFGFGSTAPHQFLVRAVGGVGINTNNPAGHALSVHGPTLIQGPLTVSGSLAGNGANLTNVNATALGGVGSAGFWKTTGNAGAVGAFLGTTDNQPLEFRANNARVLRIEPNAVSPNLVGGNPGNLISNGVVGGFIGGGGEGAAFNRVGGDFASVLGGLGNTASGDAATAMGFSTTASGNAATAMGYDTRASGNNSTALGYATTASGAYATALGHFSQALHAGALVWADASSSTPFVSTANHQFLLRATGGVGINTNNPTGAALAVNGNVTVAGQFKGGHVGNTISNGVVGGFIGGGGSELFPNRVIGNYAAVLGGFGNTASGTYATALGRSATAGGEAATAMGVGAKASAYGSVAMGNLTSAGGFSSTALGILTTANGEFSTAMGDSTLANGEAATAMGAATTANGDYSTAMGYFAQALHHGTFVWADATSSLFSSTKSNQFSLRASGGMRLSDETSLEFGGGLRQMLNLWSTNYGIGVQSGSLYFRCNNGTASDGFIWYRGGAHHNGYANAGGGTELMHLTNDGLDVNGEIHWGAANVLSVNQHGSIELGNSTSSATTPFLDFHYGVAADQDYNTRLINSGDQQLDIARIGSSTPMARFNSGGLTVNGTFVSTSDRNAKENFEPVDAQDVLNKVAALPLALWNYKEDRTQRHLGPMAQDFHAAFGVGPDDKHIATVDADGVAFAAIQGLNQKIEEKEARIQALEKELAALRELVTKRLTQ